jgi:hypothetical protein
MRDVATFPSDQRSSIEAAQSQPDPAYRSEPSRHRRGRFKIALFFRIRYRPLSLYRSTGKPAGKAAGKAVGKPAVERAVLPEESKEMLLVAGAAPSPPALPTPDAVDNTQTPIDPNDGPGLYAEAGVIAGFDD